MYPKSERNKKWEISTVSVVSKTEQTKYTEVV